jgi:chromosome segregation ATPase
MIRRLLGAFGLATRAELDATEAKLRSVRQRLEKTTDRMTQATSAAEHEQHARREDGQRHKATLAELESDYERRAARAEEAAAHRASRIATLEEDLRKRDLQREADMRDETMLEQRVAAASQEVQVAHQFLAAIEVKLDILEGAANVLDARVRAARGANE